MSYSQPSASEMKARFPAFSGVDDAVLDAALVRARQHVDASWIESDRVEAELLYAAHDLTLDGIGETREAQLTGFKSLKLDTLQLVRQDTDAEPGSLKSTSFGARFVALRKRSFPGVSAV